MSAGGVARPLDPEPLPSWKVFVWDVFECNGVLQFTQ
jgi:hypothetical protein